MRMTQPQPAVDIDRCLHGVIEAHEGLIDNHNNRALIENFVREHHDGWFSSETVTNAIEKLEKLERRPVEPRVAVKADALLQNKVFAELQPEFPKVRLDLNSGNIRRVFDYLWQHRLQFETQSVRYALQNLQRQGVLESIPPPPLPAPIVPETPPEPVEVLERLPNGEIQLSLSTPDWKLERASKTQLRDFLRRAKQ
jgi:hypothetical protein